VALKQLKTKDIMKKTLLFVALLIMSLPAFAIKYNPSNRKVISRITGYYTNSKEPFVVYNFWYDKSYSLTKIKMSYDKDNYYQIYKQGNTLNSIIFIKGENSKNRKNKIWEEFQVDSKFRVTKFNHIEIGIDGFCLNNEVILKYQEGNYHEESYLRKSIQRTLYKRVNETKWQAETSKMSNQAIVTIYGKKDGDIENQVVIVHNDGTKSYRSQFPYDRAYKFHELINDTNLNLEMLFYSQPFSSNILTSECLELTEWIPFYSQHLIESYGNKLYNYEFNYDDDGNLIQIKEYYFQRLKNTYNIEYVE
jgi:hypothetical protein